MTNKETVVSSLIQATEQIGIIPTLYSVFGKTVAVKVPFTKKACETEIDEIDFSPRANHALKRASIFSIGQVIDVINGEDGLKRIRNLGTKTENEIKTKVLAFAYGHLNDKEKRIFFYDILEANCILQ